MDPWNIKECELDTCCSRIAACFMGKPSTDLHGGDPQTSMDPWKTGPRLLRAFEGARFRDRTDLYR